MKTFLFIFLSMIFAFGYSEDRICVIEKSNGEIKETLVYSSKNETTLKSRYSSDVYDILKIRFNDSDCDNLSDPQKSRNLKYDNGSIVVNNLSINKENFTEQIRSKIALKQKILAINELLKTATGAEATELQKQKTEAEAQL